MTTIEKIVWLQNHAHTFHIDINDHRSCYQPLDEYLEEQSDWVQDDVRAECLKRGQVVLVRCYPSTPVGFLGTVHFDLATAIDIVHGWVVKDLAT